MTRPIFLLVFMMVSYGLYGITRTVCASGCDHSTIQAAINAASAFDVIQVNDAIHTELSITVNKSNLTIKGLGQSLTIVQAHSTQASAADRIFVVNSSITVIFEDMTLRHGNATGRGGGILLNDACSVTMNNVTMNNNDATEDGGAIATASSTSGITLILNECIIANNNGGTSDMNAEGGGIYNAGGNLTMTNTSVVNNNSGDDAGGVYLNEPGAIYTLTNCTISGNASGLAGGTTATIEAGGLNVLDGTATVINCTIASNTTTGFGGGIAIPDGGIIHLTNTIVADNVAGEDGQDIVAFNSTISTNNNNLVEDCFGGGCLTFSVTTDPGLQALATCTGGQYLHEISSGSSAENAGTNTGAPSDDICGGTRNNPPDLGAFEIGTVLPIELISFNGNKENEGILLRWLTASEVDNYGFEIERSVDGERWELLTFVEGVGTTTEVSEYHFLDESPLNNNGNNFYRLRQVDRNGMYQFSPIISIAWYDNIREVKLFPNPVIGKRLNIALGSSKRAEVTIFNAVGKLLKSNIVYNDTTLSLSELVSGIYIVEISTHEGKWMEKIVIP